MAVSYKKLWKLLIDKDMKKKDLAELANISTYTINKLNHGDNVNVDTLVRICIAGCPKQEKDLCRYRSRGKQILVYRQRESKGGLISKRRVK